MDNVVNTSFKMAHEKINGVLTPKGLFRNMIVAMSQFPRNHRRPVMPGTRFKNRLLDAISYHTISSTLLRVASQEAWLRVHLCMHLVISLPDMAVLPGILAAKPRKSHRGITITTSKQSPRDILHSSPVSHGQYYIKIAALSVHLPEAFSAKRTSVCITSITR